MAQIFYGIYNLILLRVGGSRNLLEGMPYADVVDGSRRLERTLKKVQEGPVLMLLTNIICSS
jgi:hypothetical protein